MKRNELIDKLVNEGLSEKTLSKFTDKQISDLSERLLGEQMSNQPGQTQVTANVNDPNFKQVMDKLKQSGVQNVNVTEEGDVNEDDEKPLSPKALKRKNQVDQGAYDGRYKTKIVPDKKKQASKEWARDKGMKDLEEEKPSAGLSKEKKSEVVKKAKKGDDIGKKGKGFEKIADKAAEKYGSKEKGEKVAAAAMWKNVKRESVETNNWVKGLVENEYFHNFTSKNEIMELIQSKLTESDVAVQHGPNVKKGHNGVPEFMSYDSIVKSSGPVTKPKPTTKPTTKPGTKPGNPYQPGPGDNPKPKASFAEEKK